MRKMNKFFLPIIGAVLLVGICIYFTLYNPNPDKITDLKRGCIQATTKAIELEIVRHQKWLETPQEQWGSTPKEEIVALLEKLQADLEKYKNIQVQDYALPQKVEVIAEVDKLKEDDILRIEGLTRSGPFYHIVGIVGDDYTVVKPGKYQMTLYLVYPRHYPFPSYYVYIAAYKRIDT